MARVRVHNFTISLDGYGAGPHQTRETPLGVGGEALQEWLIPTRPFQRINAKTVRQYVEARPIDELHVAIAPRLLGSGEHLWYGLDLTTLGYECTTHVPTAAATHVVLTRRQ